MPRRNVLLWLAQLWVGAGVVTAFLVPLLKLGDKQEEDDKQEDD